LFPEEIDKFMRVYGRKLLPEQLKILEGPQITEFPLHTPQGTADCHVLIIIDEAHIWFGAREHMKAISATFTWWTQARHDHTDMVCVTQSPMNVDARIRRLCDSEFVLDNVQGQVIPGFGALAHSVGKVPGLRWVGRWVLPQYRITEYRIINDKKFVVPPCLMKLKDDRIYKLYDSYCKYGSYVRDGLVSRIDNKCRKEDRWTMIIDYLKSHPFGVSVGLGCMLYLHIVLMMWGQSTRAAVAESPGSGSGLSAGSGSGLSAAPGELAVVVEAPRMSIPVVTAPDSEFVEADCYMAGVDVLDDRVLCGDTIYKRGARQGSWKVVLVNRECAVLTGGRGGRRIVYFQYGKGGVE
jgi:hypothetical protein